MQEEPRENKAVNGIIDRLRRTALQFVKFGVVGIMNCLISLAVYYIVLAINHEWYLAGNALGFLVSTLNAYLMNRRFVFGKDNTEKKNGVMLLKTYVTYTAALGISTGLLYLFVEILHTNDKLAPLLCLLITVPFTFLINKFWVYRERSSVDPS